MRRAALAVIAITLAIDSAEAWPCPHGQLWRVHLRECVDLHSKLALAFVHTAIRLPRARINVAINAPLPLPHRVATPNIPIPSLTDIEWGHLPDDELRGRLLLRAILQRKSDQ